jgi:Cu-Zn family superoxide dismutase
MRTALAAVVALVLPLAASGADAPHAARALLKDAKGEQVGMATFVEAQGGVNLAVKVQGLPPGQHGIHVHAAGTCDAPEFKGAGPHFNPGQKKHGLKSAEGHHAGDLPNLVVGPDGKGELKATLAGATLGAGAGSLFGPQGTSLVVHAGPDDETTDPAGNSGARIACGAVAHGS